MTRATAKKSEHLDADELPKPRLEKRHWPLNLVWLVPLFAAAMVGYYIYDVFEVRGPLITIHVTDATGLVPGQSPVVHLGVQIGQVSALHLSADEKEALVDVRLHHSATSFAKKGAEFWIVRPEISTQEISGLGTVLSGPVIDALPAPSGTPGANDAQTEFTALPRPPSPEPDGLRLILKTPSAERLQSDCPVYYRGIQVGLIRDVRLSTDATSADLHVLIQHRYIPLVKTNSEFWMVPAVDLKGGIFSGIQMKVESLKALISGGIAFATPEENMGEQAGNGATYVLHDEPKKDWQKWVPTIAIEPGSTAREKASLPQPPDTIRSAVGSH